MRVIGSVQSRGVEYQAIWASMSWIDDDAEAVSTRALTVRNGEGVNETIIPRNGSLADVQNALRHLRALGLKDAQLAQLFNYKGDSRGLAQQVKVLVSRLK